MPFPFFQFNCVSHGHEERGNFYPQGIGDLVEDARTTSKKLNNEFKKKVQEHKIGNCRVKESVH